MFYRKYRYLLSLVIIILAGTACQTQEEAPILPTLAPHAVLPATFTPISRAGISPSQPPSPEATATIEDVVISTLTPEPAIDAVTIEQIESTSTVDSVPVEINENGRSILYLSRPSMEPAELRVIHEDGGQPHTVSTINQKSRLLDVSPDSQFAVISNIYGETTLIDVAEHGEQIPLADTPATAAYFSPDSNSLLLIEPFEMIRKPTEMGAAPALPEYEKLSGDILLIDMSSRTEEKIDLPLSGRVQGASWSPDGGWFVLQVKGNNADGNFVQGLYRYTLATGEAELLYMDYVTSKRIDSVEYANEDFDDQEVNDFPALSPDGTTIITDIGGEYGLYIIPAAGGEIKPILHTIVPAVGGAQWSPDGEWIAILYDKDIYLLHPDGTEFHNMTKTPYHIERHPSWSADGKELLYTAETRWGGLDIWRYDVANKTSYRITKDDPKYAPMDNYSPVWGADFENMATTAVPVPIVDEPTIYSIITAPPLAPPEEIDLTPPQLTMSPPWWGERYLYRRKITIQADTPINVNMKVAERPLLVQLSFATDVIFDQLRYGEDGHDIQLAWWGGEEAGWNTIPVNMEGLDGETTVMTFPLQESISESTDQYYLYYGSMANVNQWESHMDLTDYPLDGIRNVWWREIHPLIPGEDDWQEGTVSNRELNWQNSDGRPVPLLNPEQSMDISSQFYPGEGTLSLSFNPTSLNQSGSLLSYCQERPYEPQDSPSLDPFEVECDYVPILFYDGTQFHFHIADQDITFNLQDGANHWYHFTATWQAGEFVRLYLDGEMVAESPYELPLSFVNPEPFGLFPSLYRSITIGNLLDQVGLSSEYANLFTMSIALKTEEIVNFYRAASLVDVSLAEQPEMPIVVAEIPPEGGIVMASNGRTWIKFPPDMFTKATAVTIIGTNTESTYDPYLSSFIIFPEDIYAESGAYENLESSIREMMARAAEEKPAQPLTVYHQYESGYVAFEGLINLYPANIQQELVPSDVFVDEVGRTAVAVNIDSWGNLVWMQSSGFLGTVSVVNH